MSKNKTDQKGFILIAILVVVLVLAAVGTSLVIFKKHHKTQLVPSSNAQSAKTTDPYDGWKSFKLSDSGLHFKYPGDWIVKGGASNQGHAIEIDSPAREGFYFVLTAIGGTHRDVDQNFLGEAKGTTIMVLSVPGSSPTLYLDAQQINGQIYGLGLATTPGDVKTSFGIRDINQDLHNITISAILIPQGASSDLNNTYPLATYQSAADYANVLNIFKSFSYE